MGYVAVKGGAEAIEESIDRLKYERIKAHRIVDVADLQAGLQGLVDQVMSESSLYSEELAALSIKQAQGNTEEAVFLMRAFRSTLPRKHYTNIVNTRQMFVERRISASFKDIPGGQLLGAAYDYSHRLLDFELINETLEDAEKWLKEFEGREGVEALTTEQIKWPKVVDYLRKEGLVKDYGEDDTEPRDITKESMEFPTVRSERLQILTRGQTGAVTSLGYAALRAFGALHPTVGELRVGKLSLTIGDPLGADNDPENDYYIGEIRVTEVEAFIPVETGKGSVKHGIEFQIGYGICYGQNETKAIAMSLLDHGLSARDEDKSYPTQNEEFVLLMIDCVESTGFISHLKLPHYVTFQSKLDSVRKARKGGDGSENKL